MEIFIYKSIHLVYLNHALRNPWFRIPNQVVADIKTQTLLMMSSIIQDFSYDIFISYRHKDNLSSQGFGRQASNDGWVTKFVTNLEKELEATFKEDITIYFDTNPHDGLLETHDVDESLKQKLKGIYALMVGLPTITK